MNPELLGKIAGNTVISVLLIEVAAVPLAFPATQPEIVFGEPKSFLLHLGALIVAIGLATEAALEKNSRAGFSGNSRNSFGQGWLNPVLIISFGMAALLYAQSVATLLSPIPRISFFGANENFSGFNLYDTIALFILFSGAALKFRSVSKINLLIVTLAVTGTIVSIYGLVQHFGWDSLGNGQTNTRIYSSFGNALNFGGFLVLTIPVTLFIAIRNWRPPSQTVLLVAVALGIQFSALWFSGGRGPYVGVIFGTAILIASVAVGLGVASTRRISVALVIGAVIAIILVVIPSPSSVDVLGRIRAIPGEGSVLIGEQVDQNSGGLKARSGIWRVGLSLFRDPQVPQSESKIKTRLRSVYGLGPEMFVYSYPLRTAPLDPIRVEANAHNFPLHILVTTGLLGLISVAIVFAGVLLMSRIVWTGLRFETNSDNSRHMLAAVFIAAVLGKALELQTGVPRISDLTPAVVIFGALVAVHGMTLRNRVAAGQSARARSVPAAVHTIANHWTIVAMSMLAVTIMMTGFIGWDVRRLSASAILAASSKQDESFDGLVDAQARAPDRQSLTFALAELTFANAMTAIENGERENQLPEILQARILLQDYERRNPFDFNTKVALAKIASTLVEIGNVEFQTEVRDRYSQIAEYFPGYPSLLETAATSLAVVGEYDLAIDVAIKVIQTEDRTHGWSKAWYAAGTSLFNLGLEEDGVSALIASTKKQPGSEGARLSHQALGQIYRERGNLDLADFHSSLALE